MTDQVRMLRVLEYTGTRDRVECAIAQRAVKGEFHINGLVIKEAIIGDYLELLACEDLTL